MCIREIFADYTELIEPLSLDEAYLDVSDMSLHQGSAALIAKAIKAKIKQKTRLIASAGISYNKFLAKIASDMDRPDGLYVITPERCTQFIEQLSVEKFHGVGKATAGRMQARGIKNRERSKVTALTRFQQYFGKSGQYYYHLSRDIDTRPVNNHRIRKSLEAETTFQEDITSKEDVLEHLQNLLEKNLIKIADKKLDAHTLTVKIKYHKFVQITRSRTLPRAALQTHQPRVSFWKTY
ncbi:DNA polymerase IV 3 (fragment) [Candidatus Methylobacter favarea]|uniref:DNA polymerase IV 3 n=1 Tax=Candidatus Methylobacter favarea TaxID=2707345 RepID=A0A8S0XL77_9GAMM